jgi:hypothetical protein
VTTISGLLGLAVQTPIGAAIDETAPSAARSSWRSPCWVSAPSSSSRGRVLAGLAIANSLMAIVGDVFGPAVAALTLGLYARKQLGRRMGRNSAFDHAGNVAIAVVAARSAMPSRSAPSSFSCRSSPCSPPSRCCPFRPRRSITTGRETSNGEHDAADRHVKPRRLRHPVQIPAAGHLRPVRHAVPSCQCGAAAAGGTEARRRISGRGDGHDVGLHRRRAGGDAADRPPGRTHRRQLGTQALVSRRVRHPAHPRVLYTFSDNSFWLVGVQLLDGVGAGIFGALTPLVIADIMRGTGRYNLAQGAIATVQGIGASLSGLAAGVIVDHFGYSAAFLAAGAAGNGRRRSGYVVCVLTIQVGCMMQLLRNSASRMSRDSQGGRNWYVTRAYFRRKSAPRRRPARCPGCASRKATCLASRSGWLMSSASIIATNW